jgi:outer membrane protein OmpA-like peptidoglycan-associated protein
MMKNLLLIFFLTGICSLSFSQGTKGKFQDKMKEAERLFNQGKFDLTKTALEEVLSEKPEFSPALRLLGMLNLRTGDASKAVESYNKLFKQKSDLSRAAYYEAAEANMKVYNYQKALEFFVLYKHAQNRDYKLDEETVHRNYERYVDQNISNCEFSLEMKFSGSKDQPKLIKGNVNSEFDEYLPTLAADGDLLLFTTDRNRDENIMISKLGNGNWGQATSLGNAINTRFNEGMAKFTTCGRRIYFSACVWENVKGGCDIYMAEYDVKDGVIDQVESSIGLNSEFWDSQPSISCNGDLMFFSSTRPGGLGGADIWMSTLMNNGYWSEPVNLGPTINSPLDEEAPYIAPDGLTLYFASDGHPGMGESDIFKTVLKEDKKSWTIPENMGESVNSPYREAGLVMSPDHKMLYFSSARSGGKGGLDIYENDLLPYQKPSIESVLLDGFVYDEYSKEPLVDASIRIRSSNTTVGNFKSDKDGRFFICVPTGATYSYIVEKQGYENFIGADYFERTENEKVKKVLVYLKKSSSSTVEDKPQIQREQPAAKTRKNLSVYFESDKFDLSEIQKEQIGKLVGQFSDLSRVKIQITGFADDIGDKDYNVTLSEKRAMEVKRYILERGITEKNLSTEGKGVIESNLAKHQKRRVEIIILD